MYIPQMANAPLFEEKGETQVELSVSTNSAYASLGYACSDKYAVRKYIANKIGQQYLIPLISIDGKDCFKAAKEIDFDKLPSSFVLK